MLIGSLMIFYGFGSSVLAQSQSSGSYRIDESYIGPGGSVQSSSSSYSQSSSLGDTATGDSSSNSYQSQSGFNTTSDPRLVLVINTSAIGFGGFSASVASHAVSTFSVLNYTSSGYSVYTVGSSPSNGSHNLLSMSSSAASQVGVEQFGMNLVANTSPVTFGADPVQVPSGSFSFGTASSGYNNANNFRYNAGEKIAESVKSSGETDFTISYIVNVATTTPGGNYSGNQELLVVGSY